MWWYIGVQVTRKQSNKSITKHINFYDNENQPMNSKKKEEIKKTKHSWATQIRKEMRHALFSSLTNVPAVLWTRHAWNVPPKETHTCMLSIQVSAKQPLSSEPLLTSSYNYRHHLCPSPLLHSSVGVYYTDTTLHTYLFIHPPH